MRSQCEICDQWSRELVEVVTEFGKSSPMRYLVHEAEVPEMKRRVKIGRQQIKDEKAENLRKYGQRYAH
jgi:hypothetical protein